MSDTRPLGKAARRELLRTLRRLDAKVITGQPYGYDHSLFADCARVMEDDAAEITRLRADRDRLRGQITRLIGIIRNVHGSLLDDRIDAAIAGEAQQELPKGAVPVLNPQGTGETGTDRPAAPASRGG